MPALLIVSYWYPPAVGAAAQRMHALAKYLARAGWDVHVLTADRPGAPDDSGVTLHAADDPLADNETPFADYDPRVRPGRTAATLRDLVFPDRFVHWHKAAIRAGRAAAREHRFDAVLVSFPPASAVLAALDVSERAGLPLVLDIRDRWIGPGGYQPASPAARQRHAALERAATGRASAVVTVSEALADAVVLEHAKPRDRVWVVPNGYEPDESDARAEPSAQCAPGGDPNRFTIAHVGTVIARNRPDVFLESLRRLHEQGALTSVRFNFVGNLSRAYVASLGLSDVVETTGLVSRAEAARRMRAADALLLLTGAYVGQWGYSAKLFEYLHAGRPIVCAEETPGSNDRALLESLAPERCAFAAMADDSAIIEALSRAREIARHAGGGLPAPPGLARFSRERLAGELAEKLRGLLVAGRLDPA
ncbi:MAG: hypothetical protein DCC65_14570 [Planctomycetota bacterium]|nr:MAG: hypothetical protein DCC65_14570 [Planctomycetota bacterium]